MPSPHHTLNGSWRHFVSHHLYVCITFIYLFTLFFAKAVCKSHTLSSSILKPTTDVSGLLSTEETYLHLPPEQTFTSLTDEAVTKAVSTMWPPYQSFLIPLWIKWYSWPSWLILSCLHMTLLYLLSQLLPLKWYPWPLQLILHYLCRTLPYFPYQLKWHILNHCDQSCLACTGTGPFCISLTSYSCSNGSLDLCGWSCLACAGPCPCPLCNECQKYSMDPIRPYRAIMGHNVPDALWHPGYGNVLWIRLDQKL